MTTPPRTILSENVRLIDQNLIGSAVIYFGCDQSDTIDTLKPELYDKLSCPNAIREHIQLKVRPATSADSSNHAKEAEQQSAAVSSSSPAPSSSNQSGSGGSRPHGAAPAPQRPSGQPARNSGVVPKWFKK